MNEKQLNNFMSKVSVSESGCWIWTGAKMGNGYGVVRIDKVNKPAHRVLYEHRFGPIASGMESDHLCRTRNCVNPDHIEIVTKQENVRRGDSGKWQKDKTHCPRGHEYTPSNTMICKSKVGGRIYSGRRCKQCQKDKMSTPKMIEYNREYKKAWHLRRVRGVA